MTNHEKEKKTYGNTLDNIPDNQKKTYDTPDNISDNNPDNTQDNQKKTYSEFKKKLATRLQLICNRHELSYEEAAHMCGISSRYFGKIARGEVNASIQVLEKICNAFDRSPNDFLGYPPVEGELVYRVPMKVDYYHMLRYTLWKDSPFAVCPQCGELIEDDYEPACNQCGQKLDWDYYEFATEEKKDKE